MENDDLIKILEELIQVDLNTVHSYDRALDQISDKVVHSRLKTFRDHHRQHIADLSDEIEALGEKPPDSSRDMKSIALEAFTTALGSITGMKGALVALKTAEEMTNRYYGNVVSKTAPDAVKDLLRKHFSDEKNHLDYIRNYLQVL